MAISETKMQIVIANYFKDECDVNTSIRQAFEKGFRIGVKKGASTNRPQEWIPCSERLPKIGEHHISEPCLVYCKCGVYAFAELEENIFGKVGWNCERDDDYHEPIGEVVAWMPLPEPWKGADDGTEMF